MNTCETQPNHILMYMPTVQCGWDTPAVAGARLSAWLPTARLSETRPRVTHYPNGQPPRPPCTSWVSDAKAGIPSFLMTDVITRIGTTFAGGLKQLLGLECEHHMISTKSWTFIISLRDVRATTLPLVTLLEHSDRRLAGKDRGECVLPW